MQTIVSCSFPWIHFVNCFFHLVAVSRSKANWVISSIHHQWYWLLLWSINSPSSRESTFVPPIPLAMERSIQPSVQLLFPDLLLGYHQCSGVYLLHYLPCPSCQGMVWRFWRKWWSPFHCFGSPVWRTWRQMKTLYSKGEWLLSLAYLSYNLCSYTQLKAICWFVADNCWAVKWCVKVK